MEYALKHEKTNAASPGAQSGQESSLASSHAQLQMQQQAGNQAMQQLLRSGAIRAKLNVSQPDDPEEREAEFVANRIMRSPAGAPSSCSCSGDEDEMCDECRQKAAIARSASSHTAPVSSMAAHRVLRAIHSSHGHPLDVASRAFFEPRFGRDLAGVRIHTDAVADTSARSIHALAFTTGRDIFFSAGQFSPDSDEGRKLLAHELTHTLQKHPDLPVARPAPHPAHHNDELQTAAAVVPPLREEGSPDKINRQGDGQDAGAPPPPPPSGGGDYDLDAGVAPAEGAPPAAATPDHFDFEGMPLITNADDAKRQLEGYVEDHGLENVEGMGQRFDQQLERLRFENSPTYLSDVSGVPDWIETNRRHLAQMEEAAPVFHAALVQVLNESHDFLTQFDAEAHTVLEEMLTASEDRVNSERARYGLTMTTTEHTRRRHDDMASYTETEIETHYSMANNAGTRGMAGAATNLASKVRSVRHLMDVRNGLRPVSTSEFSVPTEEEMRPYREADQRVQDAVREYNIMRHTAEGDYPILAAYTPLDTTGTYFVDQTIQRLDTVARGSSSQLAGTLYDETAEKLANIAQVRDAVAAGSLSVWKLPSVVGLASQRIHTLPPLMQARLTDDRVRAVAQEGEILNTALGVLAIALGALMAIPTGGSSLAAGVAIAAGIGSAALGGYFAVEHIQQYEIEAAANGTDFDKARAVSAVEPSLFWLAVDIIGALGGAAADIHAAATAFRGLSATVREAAELRQLAQQGQRAAEADAAMARLVQEGDQVAPGLGRRLSDAVAHQGGAIERDARIAAWEEGLSPVSRAELVDNPALRTVYEDMDELLRWLCTHCSDDCLIKGLSRAQSARVQALAEGLNSRQLNALRDYLHARKANINAALEELEHAAEVRSVHAQEQHPEGWHSRESSGDLTEFEGPEVPEGQRLPRGSETPDLDYGGMWGGERGDSEWFSDIHEVNQVTGYRPIRFRDGFPDFSPWARERVRIPVTGADATDFAAADAILARQRGFPNQTAYANWRSANRLTWHHVEGAEEMILVPRDLHENVPHVGGASQARTAGAATTP